MGFCDDDAEPIFSPGTTSVTFTGAHFRMRNCTKEDTWKGSERFVVGGKEVVHRKGDPVPENLAPALRALRREAPDLWDRPEKLNVEIHQQPAGFDDNITICWKVEHQASKVPCSIRLVDAYGSGLSEEVEATSALYNQLLTSIEPKMTAAVQVTDTDEAMRLKAAQRRKEPALRKELMKLANLEATRPVFKCGVYEVLKLLADSLEELFRVFAEQETLKKACVRNMWTVLRPNLTEQKFIKVREQAWAEGLKFGTHRLKKSWVQKRFDNLDEDGFPLPPSRVELPEALKDCTYHAEAPGSLQELSTWKWMVENGEMTEEALQELSVEPWLEHEVHYILFSVLTISLLTMYPMYIVFCKKVIIFLRL